MSVLHADHDPSNYEGYTRFVLEIYQRFANVAVEWHLDDNLSSVNAHETGIVDMDQLASQYDLPVIMTIPTGAEGSPRTTAADEEILSYSVSAWVADYDQPYALTEAQILISEVVNNVEDNRSLADQNGENPLAEDATKISTDYDFALNPRRERGHLKYGTARFEVKTKRRIPAGNIIK